MSNERSNKTKYIIIDFISICFFAMAGIFVRNSTLSSLSVGLWRIIFALPFLFFFSCKKLKKVSIEDIIKIFLSGVCFAIEILLFNEALLSTTLANANLITNLTSFVIVPVSYFIFKEKIPKFYLVGLLIAIFGVVVLIMGKKSPTKTSYMGDIIAGIACIFYSIYILSSYKLRDRIDSSSIVFISSVGAAFVLFLVGIFTNDLQVPKTSIETINLLMLALSMQVIGRGLFSYCQGMVSANLSSAIALLQPVIAGIYSLVLFNEKLTTIEIIGMGIVILGVYVCKRQYNS